MGGHKTYLHDGDLDTLGGVINLARVAGSTFSTIQHLHDIFHSTGWTSGGGITNDLDGTVTVSSGTGFIRAINDSLAQILFTDWAAESGANVSLIDNDSNFIYVEWNAGSPRVIATINERTDFHTNILLAIVFREGTTLHITSEVKHTVGDHANLMIQRLKEISPFARSSGGTISETGTRNVAVSAGVFWEGLTKFTTAAFDSSTADTFKYFYDDGASGWTEVAAQSQINNTQYDNGSGSLATLTNNKYGVHWVYLEVDSEVSVLYGKGDYTLSEAQDADAPASIPKEIERHSRLIGKIIIKKSDASFTEVLSAFDVTLDTASPTDHSGLTSLQGGQAGEYYHLTTAEYAALGSGKFIRTFYDYNTVPVSGTFNSIVCGLSTTSIYGKNRFGTFDKTTEEARHFAFILPASYTAGNDIKVTVVNTGGLGGTVVYNVGLEQPDGSDKFISADTSTEYIHGTSVIAAAFDIKRTEFIFDGTNLLPGDPITILIFRDTLDAADDLNGDSFVSSYLIEEQ